MLRAFFIVLAALAAVSGIVLAALYYKLKKFVANTGQDESWSQEDGTSYLDIVYDAETGNKLDIFIPAHLDSARVNGVILFVHDNEGSEGCKEWERHNCYRYAKAGYVTAAAGYSLHTEENPVTMYAVLDELEAATRKIKELSRQHGWNIQRLALSGTSAGGHLALLFAYSRHAAAFPVEFVAVGSAPIDFHWSSWDFPGKHKPEIAVTLVNRGTGNAFNRWEFRLGAAEAAINSISPLAMVDEHTVPTLMAYGGRDRDQNPQNGQILRKKLNEHGVKNDLVEFPHSDHYLAGDEEASQLYMEKFLEYLRTHFGY
jgi:acetyl esterase/lipase